MSAKKKTAFLSNGPNQQVVIDSGREELRDPNGAVLQVGRPPVLVNFVGNRLETDDADTIKKLREDDLFQHPQGWWEEGKAPDEPKPTRGDQNKAIVKATAKGDVAELESIRDSERENHNRFDVIEAAETAISEITHSAAEEAGAVHRTDLPAEKEDGVGKVDPLEPPEGTPLTETDAERVTRSEGVAVERANAQAAQEPAEEPEEPKQPVEEKIEAEVEVAQSGAEGEKAVEKIADAGKAPAPKSTSGKKSGGAGPKGQRKSASKSTASGANDGDSGSKK